MGHLDLTTGNILTHIRKIAIPASLGFLFNTLFNVVDLFFAGFLGADSLAGLSMSFPIFFMIIAFSVGIGSGTTALLSIALGKKQTDQFHILAKAALVLACILSFILFFSGSKISPILFEWIGAEGGAFLEGVRYTNIIFYGSFFFVTNNILNSLLNSQGDTKSYRNSILIGFGLNVLLDPLFILGWFGLPKFGIAGIAWATIIAQAVSSIYLLYRLNKSSLFSMTEFRVSKLSTKAIVDIMQQGIPSSLNLITIGIGSFIIQHFVVRYGGELAIAGYGAAFRIEQLALLPNVGLNIAVLTITGQNFGANNITRIYTVYKYALLMGSVILTIGILFIYPLAEVLVGLFASNLTVVDFGANYLRIEVLVFYAYLLMFISNSVLQGIKKPKFGFFISLYRQIFLPLFLFVYLADQLQWGIYGIWWGIVFINWSAAMISVIYTLMALKKTAKISAVEM